MLNQGIGGNAVVTGGLGPTATQRFERDALEQRGVRWVIVLEGVNDIGGPRGGQQAADGLIAAYGAHDFRSTLLLVGSVRAPSSPDAPKASAPGSLE